MSPSPPNTPGDPDDPDVAGETEERSGTLPFTGGDFALMAMVALAILGAGTHLASG